MASFTPLNVEPGDSSDEELDFTKELQIEEALKTYHHALKLHSQGPDSYDEAEAAYKELFKSEIFHYPEGSSPAKQLELYGDDQSSEEEEQSSLTPDPSARNDGTPSSLPQILYLSYKNHAQLILDIVQHRLKELGVQELGVQELGVQELGVQELGVQELGVQELGVQELGVQELGVQQLDGIDSDTKLWIHGALTRSLSLMVEAIARDETDLFLWRQISRVSRYLGSNAVARFCLEAVLDTGDQAPIAWPEPPSIEGLFAARYLKEVLCGLGDIESAKRHQYGTYRETGIVKALQKHSDPCPYLPLQPGHSTACRSQFTSGDLTTDPRIITVDSRTWVDCTRAIMKELDAARTTAVNAAVGICYVLALPASETIEAGDDMEPHRHDDGVSGDGGQVRLDHNTTDLGEAQQDNVEASPPPQVKPMDGLIEPQVSSNAKHTSIASPADIPADSDMNGQDGESQLISPINDVSPTVGPRMMSLPTRKRSVDSAGLGDNMDTGRSKSKRIRARTSINEGSTDPEVQAAKMDSHYESELWERNLADTELFNLLDSMLKAVGSDTLSDLEGLKCFHKGYDHSVRQQKSPPNPPSSDFTAWCGFVQLLDTWDSTKNQLWLRKDHNARMSWQNESLSGLETILEQSQSVPAERSSKPPLNDDTQIQACTRRLEGTWASVESLAMAFVEQLLAPTSEQSTIQSSHVSSLYDTYVWPENLKCVMSQLLMKVDDYLFVELEQRTRTSLTNIQHRTDRRVDGARKDASLIQAILEMHLDSYQSLPKEMDIPSAQAVETQRIRMSRWHALALDAFTVLHETRRGADILHSSLEIRFTWSTMVLNKLIDQASGRAFSLVCYKDMAQRLKDDYNDVVFDNPNSRVLPQISSTVVEREIAKLSTVDFFQHLFNPRSDDPVVVIENLEPLLDRFGASEQDHDQQVEHLLDFLAKANIPFKLTLWQRLTNAYVALDYLPRVVACNIEQIALLLEYLPSLATGSDQRSSVFLQHLKDLDILINFILKTALEEPNAFEFLDENRLKAAISTMVRLIRLLQVFILWEDSVQVGQLQAPRLSNTQAMAFSQSRNRVHDLIVKVWLLQFFLWKEAVMQSSDVYQLSVQDLKRFLIALHAALGSRQYCGSAENLLPRLMKAELLRSMEFEEWETELSQIVYDLHDIHILPNPWQPKPHGCTPAAMDRGTAVSLLDIVLIQANRLSIKDLCKSDLRHAIEAIQEAIQAPKPTSSSQHNKRLIIAYLKAPINPTNLYRSLQGIGGLSGIMVDNESGLIAAKGWYFLLGHMALTKFRSQKRVANVGSVEELGNAEIFFRQDLELDPDKWETWYRLAQVHDARIDEYIAWSAEKMNTNSEDLKTHQRHALHCYTMAVAIANQHADPSFENVEKLFDLYNDFGIRLYASTREPFSVASDAISAFSLEAFARHFSAPQGMYIQKPFKELQPYAAWQFAASLFRRALSHRSKVWTTHYMLGKCLWKMHTSPERLRGKAAYIDADEAIAPVVHAIESLPSRDNRHPEKDPILEPHYKLMSITHKLVRRGEITAQKGQGYLGASWYSRKIVVTEENTGWKDYILRLLKIIRDADKANWHHRIVARMANVVYEQGAEGSTSPLDAKQQMMSQIFTKTMMIQVWKPENERVGRHFVYTSRYVMFITKLSIETGDRPSLEALAKSIRKKSNKFFNHSQIWNHLCTGYLGLLRDQGQIQADLEAEYFKPMSLEAFTADAERVDAWAHLKDTKHPLLDILREAVELKRLNNSLMKGSSFDDLVVDTYATIFREKASQLLPPSSFEDKDTVMSVSNIILDPNMQLTAGAPPPTDTCIERSVTPGEPASYRARGRGVTKREVQRRAEALVITVNKHWNDKLPREEPTQAASLASVHSKDDDTRDGASSVPGSVHDSADDESELSDLDEVIEAPMTRPTFPNLMISREDEDTQTEDGTISDDGNAAPSSPKLEAEHDQYQRNIPSV